MFRAFRNSLGKPEGTYHMGEQNIDGRNEIVCEVMHLIQLTWSRLRCGVLINTVMNCLIPLSLRFTDHFSDYQLWAEAERCL